MTDDKVIDFEALELEQEDGTEESPSQLETLLKYVEGKLSPEDFAGLRKELGIEEEDLSNKDLLEKLMELLGAAKPEEEEEEEEEEMSGETEMMDQKAFMEECLAGGKSREECLAEWQKKSPEPKEESAGEPEEETGLAGEVAELKQKLAEMEKEKNLAEVSADIDKLIAAKHLAPVQKDQAIKLAASQDKAGRENLYGFWRAQRFTVSDDVGMTETVKPGDKTAGITVERRTELLKLHGLDDLIQDKADKSKLPWRNN